MSPMHSYFFLSFGEFLLRKLAEPLQPPGEIVAQNDVELLQGDG